MAKLRVIGSILCVTISLCLSGLSHGWSSGSKNGPGRFNWARKAFSQEKGAVGNIQKEVFPLSSPPYLAIITDRDACDSEIKLQAALKALYAAVSTGQVDLVSVRVNVMSSDKDLGRRVVELTRQLMNWSDEHSFQVVVSSDWVSAAVEAKAHGVHVKEMHRHLMQDIRRKLGGEPLIGTSAHSVESAVSAFEIHRPDYIFVGTCYATQSHPGKIVLEGPELPGEACRALEELAGRKRPKVFAIGGIDASNCHIPVGKYGADGIATIRAVLEAEDPGESVRLIRENMMKC